MHKIVFNNHELPYCMETKIEDSLGRTLILQNTIEIYLNHKENHFTDCIS